MFKKLFASAVVASAFVAQGAYALAGAPDELVRTNTQEILAAIKADKDLLAGDTKKIEKLAEEKVLPYFNFAKMTQLAVGRNWKQASDAQKMALTNEFRQLLVRTYSSSLSQYRNQTIDVKPLKFTAADTDVVVKTVINQSAGAGIPIDYSMEKVGDSWKVYDVLIDGVSMVTNYRSTFNSEIQQGGIDGLVKSLAARNAKNATK